MSRSEGKHNRLVNDLAERLRQKGTYDSVETEVPFYRGRGYHLAGRMDVCATRTVNGVLYVHNYEIKTGWPKFAHKEARRQGREFYRAMEYLAVNPKFIYVGRDGVKRYGA